MKTTLKYNTIETLQRQPAWKKYIDTLVDECNTLYDDQLIADVEDGTTKSGDAGILEISTLKLSESDEPLQPKYATFDYNNDATPMGIQENISIRGLLKTLSIYGCKIKDISFNKLLPHTFKKDRTTSPTDTTLYGYEVGSAESYDFQAAATIDGVDYEEVDYNIVGEQPAPSYDSTYEYIKNIYGYSQKHPVVYASQIREVKEFYQFVAMTPEDYRVRYTIPPEYFDIDEYSYLLNAVYIDENTMTIDDENHYCFSSDIFYYSINSKDSGVRFNSNNKNLDNWYVNATSDVSAGAGNVCRYDDESQVPSSSWRHLTREELLKRCYIKTNNIKRWTPQILITNYEYLNEPIRYILIDECGNDLKKENNRIIFNTNQALSVYEDMCIQSDASLISANFTKVQGVQVGENSIEDQVSHESMRYNVYIDSFYNKTWIVLDDFDNYFDISPYYLKNQLFADECSLKAQPLFLYKDGDADKISMCANFIDAQGGEGNVVYEIERYDKKTIHTTYDTIDNITYPEKCGVKGISYGSYFYKWEQLNKNNETFIQDVYAAINFSNYDMHNTPTHDDPFNFYFNGDRDMYRACRYDDTEEKQKNNIEKINDGYIYRNTFRQDYFETMYFNHFVKVYPIDGVTDGNTIAATKLYCDSLELVEFGDIIPYIVSYDRKGEYEIEDEDEGVYIYKNLDCSVFSKILSYNKRTHLIIVDTPVTFINDKSSKYVVVAYQNATPFNKIQTLGVVAPNDEIKEMMKKTLVEYENQYCELEIKTESKNLVLNSNSSFSTNNSNKWFYLSRKLNRGEIISISLDVDAKNVTWSSSDHRAGMIIEVPMVGGGTQNIDAWWTGTGSYQGRIKTESVLLQGDLEKESGFGIYIQNLGSGTIKLSNPQVEIGDKATEYNLATDELEYEPI